MSSLLFSEIKTAFLDENNNNKKNPKQLHTIFWDMIPITFHD